MCEKDEAFRSDILAACKASPLFWMNAFGWTFRQRFVNDQGEYVQTSGHKSHYPMITWPIQDETVAQLSECVNIGDDVNVDKSRDMGATWLALFLFDHQFLFEHERNFGVVSRKESLVDSTGDMDSLFEKLRYINSMLPSWMLPPIKSRYMHLKNNETGSTIAGESTNADVGRGGRKTAYLVDEAAAIQNAMDVESSLSQTTACQIWVSTAKGPNTQFHNRIIEKRGRYLQLPWYRHPEKAVKAKQYRDELGRIKWTSPWYEITTAKMSPKAVAQEIDMDHGQAGDLFFDHASMERHRQDHEEAPWHEGELVFTGDMPESDQIDVIRSMDYGAMAFIKAHSRRRWKLWMELENGRPPQDAMYVLGLDISNGSGHSNSVISVLDAVSGRYVAKFWDAYISPEQLAQMAAMAGVWFGGFNAPAFVIWENNGPGGIFGRKIVKMQYPRFYMQRAEGNRQAKKSNRYGWHSTSGTKELLLGLYREALFRDDVIMHCHESIVEAQDYIYGADGVLIPSRLREETSGGRALHGDHVIADALCVLAREEMPKQRDRKRRPPKGSFAHRRDSQRNRRRKEDSLI